LLTIGLTVAPLLTIGEEMAPAALWITSLVGLILGVPFLVLAAWFPSMHYELDSDALRLRCGPYLNYRIPYDEIETIRAKDLRVSLWSSVRLPGLALWGVPYLDEGTIKMCATAAATDILLVETATDKFGMTPADREMFVTGLRSRVER
jgi:hypothetical protein